MTVIRLSQGLSRGDRSHRPTRCLIAMACLTYLWPAARASAQLAAPAPAAPQVALDLVSAVRVARRTGPLRRIADARETAATGRVREIGQFPNPTLEWRRENLGSALQPDIFATAYIPVDVTGRRQALRQATRAGQQRAQEDAVVERREAEVEVARTWLRAAAAEGALNAADRMMTSLREVADVDARRFREGLVAEAVALRTQLEADRARLSWVSATGEAAHARAQLARMLGLPIEELAPLAPLTGPRMPVAPDSLAARDVALRHRPEVRAKALALQEAQRRASAERRGVFSDLQLQGGTKQTSGVLTGQVGFAMPMPLFNRNVGARERTAGELAEAQTHWEDVTIAVRGSVLAAGQAYTASRLAEQAALSMEARGLAVARSARVAYTEGHASLTELLDAERAASDAMLAHVRWAVDAWMARLEFERVLSARLDDSSPLELPLLSTLLPPER